MPVLLCIGPMNNDSTLYCKFLTVLFYNANSLTHQTHHQMAKQFTPRPPPLYPPPLYG